MVLRFGRGENIKLDIRVAPAIHVPKHSVLTGKWHVPCLRTREGDIVPNVHKVFMEAARFTWLDWLLFQPVPDASRGAARAVRALQPLVDIVAQWSGVRGGETGRAPCWQLARGSCDCARPVQVGEVHPLVRVEAPWTRWRGGGCSPRGRCRLRWGGTTRGRVPL